MKRKVIIVLLLLTLFSISTYADFRFDIGITVPAYVGITLDTGEGAGAAMEYLFVVPDLQLHYIFDLGIVKLGAGFRAYTLIIESLIMPDLLVEVDLDPLVLHGGIFGGAFFVFGIYSDFATEAVCAIDINAAYRFAEWFKLGIGGMVFTEFDPSYDIGAYPYIVYAFCTFSFSF